MKIVIAGVGKVGYTVARRLCREGHEVTLIDEKAEVLKSAESAMDVMICCGNCAAPGILREAEAGKCEVFIAATGNDEANLVACQIARKLGAGHTIARLRNQQYLESGESLREIMDLSLAINPDYVTAEEISRVLQFPAATQVDSFPDCEMEIVTFRITEHSRLRGMELRKLPSEAGRKVLVCAVERGGSVRIPDGSFVLEAGDRISVTAEPKILRRFFEAMGAYHKPAKTVLILGGSRIAVYLTQLLESTGVKVTIIESSHDRCQQLAELLQTADVICADGTDTTVLTQNRLQDADGFVALTNIDEENIILSMYAEKLGVEKVVSKINNDKFTDLLRDVFPDTTLSPKNLVAERIEGYVRGLANVSGKSTIEALYYLGNQDVTATEFIVGAKAACVGKTLKELRLKPGVLVSTVVSGGKTSLADGNTALRPGDRAVVITSGRRVLTLDDILA